jgi:hypothetical protein
MGRIYIHMPSVEVEVAGVHVQTAGIKVQTAGVHVQTAGIELQVAVESCQIPVKVHIRMAAKQVAEYGEGQYPPSNDQREDIKGDHLSSS